jgi:hypothetical protein
VSVHYPDPEPDDPNLWLDAADTEPTTAAATTTAPWPKTRTGAAVIPATFDRLHWHRCAGRQRDPILCISGGGDYELHGSDWHFGQLEHIAYQKAKRH